MPVSQSVVRSAVCAEPLLTRAPPARLPPLHTSAQGSGFFFFVFQKCHSKWFPNTVSFCFWVGDLCWLCRARAQMIRLKFDDEYARLSVIHNLISTLEISVKECVSPLWAWHSRTHALTHAHAYILCMDCVFTKCEYIGDSYNSVSLDWFLPSTALICYRYDYRYLRLISSNSEIKLIWFMSYCIRGKRKSDLLFKYTADSLLNMLLKTEHSNEFVSCSGSLSNS